MAGTSTPNRPRWPKRSALCRSVWRHGGTAGLQPSTKPPAPDPDNSARRVWREEGRELAALANGMRRPDDAHAPYLDAAPGRREAVHRAAGEVGKALEDDRLRAFARLTETIDRQWEVTGIEPFYLSSYGEMIAEARALAGLAGLMEDEQTAVESWLQYDEKAAGLRDRIRDWPGRAQKLLDHLPPSDAALDDLTGWRQRAEALLEESRYMRAANGPHAPHLEAMPRERKALDEAIGELDAEAAAVEIAEAKGLMQSGQLFEERTGRMAYDAPTHGALIERVRALDARPDLPEGARNTVAVVLGYDARVTRDRQEVGAFLDAAREVEEARGDLEADARMRSMPAERLPGWHGWREMAISVVDKAETLVKEIPERELAAHLAAFGAGPNGIEEKEKKIREQIARDAQARAAAEEERRAAEQARDAEDRRRDIDRLQAMLDAVQERGALTGRLRECLQERETAEADGGRFIHREEYKDWRSDAESLLAETNQHLDEAEKLAPRPEKEPGPDTLRTLSAKLERTLREDRAELERIRRERTEEKTRQQDRSQDRGFSW